MESRFYLPLALTTRGETKTQYAPFTSTLPTKTVHVLSDVCVLSVSEPPRGLEQGLYVWNGRTWVLGANQRYVSLAFKDDYDIHVYIKPLADISVEEGTLVFRNGNLSTGNVLADNQVWVTLTPKATKNGEGTDPHIAYSVSLPSLPYVSTTVFYTALLETMSLVEHTYIANEPLDNEYVIKVNGTEKGRITFNSKEGNTSTLTQLSVNKGDVLEVDQLNDNEDPKVSVSITFKFKISEN